MSVLWKKRHLMGSPSSVPSSGLDMIPDRLDEVTVSCHLAGDNPELPPVVSVQDGEHGRHLVVYAGGKLQVSGHLSTKMVSRSL